MMPHNRSSENHRCAGAGPWGWSQQGPQDADPHRVTTTGPTQSEGPSKQAGVGTTQSVAPGSGAGPHDRSGRPSAAYRCPATCSVTDQD